MKTTSITLLICSLFASSASAFTVVTSTRLQQHLYAAAPKVDTETDMSAEGNKEIRDIQQKWNEVRMYSREEAASKLEGDWKEAHDRFFEKYDSDMEMMKEITSKLAKQIEPPKVEKKTKGQRKRDAYAKKVALVEARANKK